MEENRVTGKALIALLETLNVLEIVQHPETMERFKELYKLVHRKSQMEADAYYETEAYFFLKMMKDSLELQRATKTSIYGAFIGMALLNLSYDPALKLVYLYSSGVKTSPKNVTPEVWEQRAKNEVSPYGELTLRIRAGQVKYVDNPVLVYSSDEFEYGTQRGTNHFYVHHIVKNLNKREKNTPIIAGYVKITRPDDSVDYKVLTADEFESFRSQSKMKDGAAYTTWKAGMFMVKTLKHAWKNYPKLSLGAYISLSTDDDNDDESINEYNKNQVFADLTPAVALAPIIEGEHKGPAIPPAGMQGADHVKPDGPPTEEVETESFTPVKKEEATIVKDDEAY